MAFFVSRNELLDRLLEEAESTIGAHREILLQDRPTRWSASEDGSVYRQNRPTQLDEIKNFHAEVRSGHVILC